MKTLMIACTIVLSALILTACRTKEEATVNTIDAAKAKDMIDQNEDVIILDVRTKEEYDEGHILGSVLIPDYELAERAKEELEDSTATILVYCRSGRRSAEAAKLLTELGYTDIYDFGGIIDWPYEVVKD